MDSVSAFLLSKFNALFFSLGGALLALSFRDDAKRSYILGLLNILGSWFIGYTLGEAIVQHYSFLGGTANFVFVVSASVGLLLIGGIHKLASHFFKNPTEFIRQATELFKRR